MRIAYIICPGAVMLGNSNGIRAQALKWAEVLRTHGNDVTLIDSWGDYRWTDFDVIHVFGGFSDLCWYLDLRRRNPNLCFSPIWDSNKSVRLLRLLRKISFPGVHHPIVQYVNCLQAFKGVFVRSSYESSIFREAFDVPAGQLHLVPLGYEVDPGARMNEDREDVCFHVSTLYQPRKNVLRLVEAAKRYGFRLVLAGCHGTDDEFAPIAASVAGAPNVEVRGFLPSEEVVRQYRKSRVFALPSLEEGVGLVALNAAVLGANVVITNRGGPKDYFGKWGRPVDPLSVDAIGQSVVAAMQDRSSQPALRNYLIANYSPDAIAAKLTSAYEKVVEA